MQQKVVFIGTKENGPPLANGWVSGPRQKKRAGRRSRRLVFNFSTGRYFFSSFTAGFPSVWICLRFARLASAFASPFGAAAASSGFSGLLPASCACLRVAEVGFCSSAAAVVCSVVTSASFFYLFFGLSPASAVAVATTVNRVIKHVLIVKEERPPCETRTPASTPSYRDSSSPARICAFPHSLRRSPHRETRLLDARRAIANPPPNATRRAPNSLA
jgi:hypothetical protein